MRRLPSALRPLTSRPGPAGLAVHGSVVVLLAGVAVGSLYDAAPAAYLRPAAAVGARVDHPLTGDGGDTALAGADGADGAAGAGGTGGDTGVTGADTPPTGVDGIVPPAAATIPLTTVTPVVASLAGNGIPAIALTAYQAAASAEDAATPACHITWPLVAAIGRAESNHGRFGGAQLHADGLSAPGIVGIALDGTSSDRILDTDHGRLDGDTVYDRAVGPMQFIPSTWATLGMDGNGDGRADPFNIFDAARTTAHYLCLHGRDVSTAAGETAAILSYNNNQQYLATVSATAEDYARGVGVFVPNLDVTLPAVDPGPTGTTSGGGGGRTQFAAGPAVPSGGSPAAGSPRPSTPAGPVFRPPSIAAPAPGDPATATGCPTPTGGPTPTGTASAPTSPTSPTTSPTGTATGSPGTTPTPTGCPTGTPGTALGSPSADPATGPTATGATSTAGATATASVTP